MKTLCILIVLLSLFFYGCKEKKQSSSETNSTNITSSQSSQDITDSINSTPHNTNSSSAVSISAENPKFKVGDIITLEGEFWGWSASKAGCKNKISSPPVTRSDWILKVSDGFCIYVTGHIPAGVNKLSPKGKRVKVMGTIRQTESGQIYLDMNK